MSKLEIEFELTGLKFKINGERDDVSNALAALQQQVAGLANAAGRAAGSLNGSSEGVAPQGDSSLADSRTINAPALGSSSKTATRKRQRGGGVSRSTVEALEFRHDAAKYGNPQQSWGVADKAIWLLYVLRDSGIAKEVTGPQLAATYNMHFKAAGALHPPKVTMFLGKAKVSNPSTVGEDLKENPSRWYLTTEGEKHAQQLIKGVLNPE